MCLISIDCVLILTLYRLINDQSNKVKSKRDIIINFLNNLNTFKVLTIIFKFTIYTIIPKTCYPLELFK